MSNKPLHQTAFFRWGEWASRRKWTVLSIWLVLIILAASFAPSFQKNVTTTSTFVRGSDALLAQNMLDENFSKASDEQDLLVFHSKSQALTNEEAKNAITEILKSVQNVKGVATVQSPFDSAMQANQMISKDQKTMLAPVALMGTEEERKEIVSKLQEKIEKTNDSKSFEVYLTGNTPMMVEMIETQAKDMAKAEMFGVPVAVVVLLFAFGSIVAASLPIGLGMLGLITTFGLLGVISNFHDFDTTVQSMTSMIGLGVGIDYVLFIVRRFREELASGRNTVEAVAYTMATTGKAIFFSGITVLISMAGLFWLQANIFTNIAIGTMLVVCVMMAVSLTLLPALLALLGPKVNRWRFLRKKPITNQGSAGWLRWTNVVMKRPKSWALIGIVILLLMSIPAFQMKLGMDTGAKIIADKPSGKGMHLIEKNFSSGLISPVTIVIHKKNGPLMEQDWKTINTLLTTIQKEKEVYNVEGIPSILSKLNFPLKQDVLKQLVKNPQFAQLSELWNFDRDADTTVLKVTLNHASDSTKATKWVRDLRDQLIPDTVSDGNLSVKVGGSSMAIAELSDETWGKTPYVIGTVLALSFLLLMLAFRSIWIPLKAIVFNLLSVGASFGLLVWVFMGGHGALLGIDQIEFIQVFLPVIAFAVLFGLSMDYEVFLVSRIREEWGRTKDVSEAIAQGTSHTSGPITQAAIIMISVFLAFLITKGDTQQIGFALGMAILIDVTIVRSLLVPSVMKVLGERAWRIPNWLDRKLPHVEIGEGEAGNSKM